MLGFFIVIGLSGISARKMSQPKSVSFTNDTSVPPSTPQKPGTPIHKKTGTVMTPDGRRSARLARRRKEE